MPSSFIAYIDESGDEGFRFDKGSSQWFVLSAVIVRRQNDLEVVKVVDSVKATMKKSREHVLHFMKLNHHQRVFFIGEIAKQPVRIVSVCIHKPSLTARETFQDRYRLYYYGSRYLLERISWLCRDRRRQQDGTDGMVKLIFSNRGGMSYEDLRNYMMHLKQHTGPLDVRIAWDVISEKTIHAFIPGKRMGLQIADAVASSFYHALERDSFGYTEPRYVRMLSKSLYKHNGIVRGYGIKLWPRDVEARIAEDDSVSWIAGLDQ